MNDLNLSAQRDPRLAAVPLYETVEEVQADLAPRFLALRIRTVLDVPRDLVVTANGDMLRRAILNLSLNAIDAMPAGGELVVTAYAGTSSVELEIADSGPGLSEEVRRRAFEPFFTTKSTGTGLGLTVVNRVAEVHGGDVTAANCPEGGAAFTIRLPRRSFEAAA
ncbi:MAG: HAMP domain-containing sensor histidine kinase [Pirellulales bacterium]